MAERKKVQKIKTKKIDKKPKKAPIKSQKTVKRTESIKMTSDKPRSTRTPTNKKTVNKTNIRTPKRENSPKRNTRNTQNHKITPVFSVVKGNKYAIEKKKLISLCVSFVIILSILIFCLTSPTGPVEKISNAFELIGSGDYPATLAGTKITSLSSVDNKLYALTNSHLNAYTFSGKNFLQIQHNFNNPVLDVSKERVLIYNRESNKILISNNSGTLFENNLEKPIFCADISDSGCVAFACESASYSAQVLVFDKKMKQYYTWYLADGLISDVTLSNNGKFLAVAVLKVKNGAFYTEICCLDTDEKEPIFVKELADEIVYQIEATSSSAFVYTSNKKVSFIKWKTGEIVNANSFTTPTYFNKVSKYHLAIFGEANHSDIVLFNSSGKILHQFEHNGIIDDISVFDDRVYVLSSNKITYFDFDSTTKNTINLENDVSYILGVDGGVLGVNNSTVDFISSNLK